jgi:predicted DNA-binding protein (UPF0251 family)
MVELMAMITGQRIQDIDVKQSLSFRVRDFARSIRDIQAIARRTATRRGTVSGEQVASDRLKMETLRLAKFSEMQRILGAARRLGVSADYIENLLKDALADDMAKDLMEGDYSPYEMTPETAQQMQESSPASFRERFAAWYGDKEEEAKKRLAMPIVGNLPYKRPDEKGKSGQEHREAVRDYERELQSDKAMLDALGIPHDEAQQLLLDYYRREGGAGGKYATEMDQSQGGFKQSYRERARAIAELYGRPDRDFFAWYRKNR